MSNEIKLEDYKEEDKPKVIVWMSEVKADTMISIDEYIERFAEMKENGATGVVVQVISQPTDKEEYLSIGYYRDATEEEIKNGPTRGKLY